jgi:hypothetical protein
MVTFTMLLIEQLLTAKDYATPATHKVTVTPMEKKNGKTCKISLSKLTTDQPSTEFHPEPAGDLYFAS